MVHISDYALKQHDTHPPLSFTLSDAVGPVNLATATSVKLLMRSNAVLVTGTCTLANQTTNPGQGTYTWASGDTAFVGVYKLEFEVNWGGGKIETFPNDGYMSVEIVDDLDEVG